MGSLSSARAPALRSSSAVPFAISVLLLLFSSLVLGVNVLFCPANPCEGSLTNPCQGCLNLAPQDCCQPGQGVRAWSVDIQNANIDVPATIKFFINGGCNGVAVKTQIGTGCAWSSIRDYTGVFYYTTPPPPAQFSETDASGPNTTCSGRTVMPNAFFFSEPGQTGKWVLPASNLTEYWSQVKDIPDGETLNWLKSQGATYKEYN